MNVFTCQDASGARLHGRLRVDALRQLAGVLAYHAGHRQPWVRGTVGTDLRLPACMNQVSRHADGILPLRGYIERQRHIVVSGVSGRAGPCVYFCFLQTLFVTCTLLPEHKGMQEAIIFVLQMSGAIGQCTVGHFA